MARKLVARGAVFCIGGYQRYISPYKGFHCAYSAVTGRRSCSSYAQQAINRIGVWDGMRLMRRRFQRCALAAAALADGAATPTESKFFGQCDPAVQECKKLYCKGCLSGGLESLGD